jgi:hypothetical protein
MPWLNKLPDSRRSPPGMEWTLLRRMPRILVIGTLLPVLAAGLARLWPLPGSTEQIAVTVQMVDIYVIAAVILHWTIVLTLAIGCFIVLVMKGPSYVADAYPLPDAERPGD